MIASRVFLCAGGVLVGAACLAGFSDGKKAAAHKPAKVTYAVNVAPILNRSCVSCHRPNEVAPFSLVGYDNAKKWAAMVATVSESRQMPPWKAVKGYGEFKHESRLTDEEIKTLKAWSSAGAPRGNAKLEPKAPTFPGEWPLGKPDMIVSPTKSFKLSAEGDDVYRNFIIKTDSKEPMWVTGVDVKPGNRKIVHHVIAYLDNGNQAAKLAAKMTDGQEGYTSSGGGVGFLPSGSLGGWAPGITAYSTAKGTAFQIKPGATIVLQVHYHKTGKEETDLTKVGLYLAKEPVKKEVKLAWIYNFMLNIPAGSKDYSLSKTYNVPQDITLYSVMPHMHLLGKEMKAKAVFPDGHEQPLVFVKDWDFNWQLQYSLKEPLHLPKGSKILVSASYDNSAENPRNPSHPPKAVYWGEQTTDEMFLLVATYTVDGQDLLAGK